MGELGKVKNKKDKEEKIEIKKSELEEMQTQINKLHMMEVKMDTIEKACKTVLKRKIELLISDLEAELEELKNNSDYIPGDDGIIKDIGRDIDDMLIKIGLINRIRGKI